ncbi:hypothetical protein MJN58_23795, partial [Salmonella enterica subsp. enterica serovar Montevideo]|nr:hypothetical protein [Salmonella enterica subsp. enterica serovar Montevideo]
LTNSQSEGGEIPSHPYSFTLGRKKSSVNREIRVETVVRVTVLILSCLMARLSGLPVVLRPDKALAPSSGNYHDFLSGITTN